MASLRDIALEQAGHWEKIALATAEQAAMYRSALPLYGIPEHRDLCASIVHDMQSASDSAWLASRGFKALAAFYVGMGGGR